jgi:phosphoglycolate phosphatase
MDLCCGYEHDDLEANERDICYPEVIDGIKRFSAQVPVFIVSNCQSGYIELFLRKTGLALYVKDIECFGNTGKSKGENIADLAARNHLQTPVYVGDTQGDCDAARAAGVPFIFASYGFGAVDRCDAQIAGFAELEKFLS